MPSPLRQTRDSQRKERTRTALLDAARAVFVEKGYHPTLISDIVAEAGVGQGTFYRFFHSKRAVFEALFEQFAERLLGEFSDFSAHLPTNLEEYREASVRSLGEVASILLENREMAIFFLRQSPVIDRDFEARFEETLSAFAALARGYLEHAIRSGFARSCDTEVVSQCLVGIARQMISSSLKDELNAEDVRHLVREVIDFAFVGFGPRG